MMNCYVQISNKDYLSTNKHEPIDPDYSFKTCWMVLG